MAYKTLDGVLKIVFVVALINHATHLKKKEILEEFFLIAKSLPVITITKEIDF